MHIIILIIRMYTVLIIYAYIHTHIKLPLYLMNVGV